MTHSAQASFSTWCLEEGASNEEQSEPKKKVSFERQIGQWSAVNLTFVEQAPKICCFLFSSWTNQRDDCATNVLLLGFWQTPRRYHWRYGLPFRWRCQWGVWATRCRHGEDPNGFAGIIGCFNSVYTLMGWRWTLWGSNTSTCDSWYPCVFSVFLGKLHTHMIRKALFRQEKTKKNTWTQENLPQSF